MTENKQVQIIIRTTQEEKAIVTQKAKDKGISEILKDQLKTKDVQIANLQQIIYNRDTKLIETSKRWWEFWK